MDIAKAILDNVEADPRQKALAQHAFEVAPHEHALAPMLTNINIPRDAKADLWNAKRQSMHDPKLTRLAQIAALPKDLLDTAESHPNVTKLLMTEEKEQKSSESSKGQKTGDKAKADKEPKQEVAKPPADASNSETTSAQGTPSSSPVREAGVSDTPSRRPDGDREYYHDYRMDARGNVVPSDAPQ